MAYLLPYLSAVAFPFVLGGFILYRNRSPLGESFSRMLFVQGIWMTAVLFQIVSPSLSGKMRWEDIQFLGSGCSAALALIFAHRYEGTWFRGGRRTAALLLVFPLLTWAFAATNPLHGLHSSDAFVDWTVPFGELVYSLKPPMMVLLAPVYVTAVAGVLRLGRFAARQRGSKRLGALMACIGLALPLVGTVLTIVEVRINGRLEATSLWLVAGDALIAVGIFRYRTANILGAARIKVVENLADPVIVIDGDGYLIDRNRAAERLVRRPGSQAVRMKAAECFAGWPEAGLSVLNGHSEEAEIRIPLDGATVDLSVQMFPLRRNEGSRVVAVRDISTLRRAERSLQSLGTDLERTVRERVEALEEEIARRRMTEERLSEINLEIEKTQNEIMFTLAEVIENRGRESVRHVTRVSEYARILGRAAGMSEREAEDLANASAMHDIGKIGIPDEILLDEGTLREEQVSVMRSHPWIGYQILRKFDQPLIQRAACIALEHHERWNGTGYPDGKRGEEICLDARIVGLCDVFDSLHTPRSYRRDWTVDGILGYLRAERGGLFDPHLIDCLFSGMDEFLAAVNGREDEDSVEPIGAEP